MNSHKPQIKEINRILDKGTMSPMLQQALVAIAGALTKGDIDLAYQLSACKSFISGILNPKDKMHAFQEDDKTNEKTLGNGIYSILDGIHFQLAMEADRIPSGMLIMSAGDSIEMKRQGTHPIIKRMTREHNAIVNRSHK